MDSYVDDKLEKQIQSINTNSNIYEVGKVIEIKDFIINVSGLDNVMFYEKITIEDKAFGYVNYIGSNFISVALLKITSPINIGDKVQSTKTMYQGEYSKSSIGRVIDLFGFDKLTNKKFSNLENIPIERPTIPIMDRTSVNRPLYTGITGIDLIYPIGKGQRQLIVGDKRTGKTQICLDTIVNQRNKNVLCFYVAIGKTKKEVKTIYKELSKYGAMEYTTIICAFNDELPPVLSLIPYFATSVAQNYMLEGYDVLVCIDDLKRHAEAYREISLISGKTPGRDAYPADVFYTHSRLLEKGCQYKDGGSITILPIVETKGSDITDYITTNIISITDGQIVLSAKNFQKGQKPAIDYGLSVSRLGGAVQEESMKKIGSKTRQKLLSYLETKYIYELVDMDDMSSELKNQFMEGGQILENLSQYKYAPKSKMEMLQMFANEEELEKITNKENQNTSQQVNNTNQVSNNTQQTQNNMTNQNTQQVNNTEQISYNIQEVENAQETQNNMTNQNIQQVNNTEQISYNIQEVENTQETQNNMINQNTQQVNNTEQISYNIQEVENTQETQNNDLNQTPIIQYDFSTFQDYNDEPIIQEDLSNIQIIEESDNTNNEMTESYDLSNENIEQNEQINTDNIDYEVVEKNDENTETFEISEEDIADIQPEESISIIEENKIEENNLNQNIATTIDRL